MVSEGEVKLYPKDECDACGDSVGPCIYCVRGRLVIANIRVIFPERETVPSVSNVGTQTSNPRF